MKVGRMLQSLFIWIFYLFKYTLLMMVVTTVLQSLFIWIFYLFKRIENCNAFPTRGFNPYSSGFSIYLNGTQKTIEKVLESFNPYSSGFSIYLNDVMMGCLRILELQSLFIWIFYLFFIFYTNIVDFQQASILIHLDFLSI